MFLAMYYNPSPDKAYQSIDYIMNGVPLGSVLRGIHHWGAGAMVLAVFFHMLANFFSGSFKAPREGTWIIGVLLFLVTLGLGFTGYLLPWDMKAYWATMVSTNIPKDIPLIGDFIARTIRGGATVSGLTLTRFYAIHMLLSASAAGYIHRVSHLFVRLHGLAEPEHDLADSHSVLCIAFSRNIPSAARWFSPSFFLQFCSWLFTRMSLTRRLPVPSAILPAQTRVVFHVAVSTADVFFR